MAGMQVTIVDNFGKRKEATVMSTWHDTDSQGRPIRYVALKMLMDIDDPDDVEELQSGPQKPSKKRPRGGGLAKKELGKNKSGKVVSKKKSAKEEKSPGIAACSAARKALNIEDFAVIKKGSPSPRKQRRSTRTS